MKIHFVLPLLHRENDKQKGAILVILAIRKPLVGSVGRCIFLFLVI